MKKVAIKASNNKYVQNQNDGQLSLKAVATQIGSGETFELEQLSGAFVLNVKDYGAVGDAVTDDRQAIQNAINDAVANKGGTVYFPPGRYFIGDTLTVNGLATLCGAGFSTNNVHEGSFIYFKQDINGPALEILGRAVTVERLGFYCDQPAISENWSPYEYGGECTIHIRRDDVTLRNIFLYNVTRGIAMANATGSIGRITLDRIFGQPLTEGIKVDNALDVVKISNVHFWPFWSDSTEVRSYQVNHATGLVSYRNDNPFYSDIFCLGYFVGMLFGTSEQPSGTGIDANIWGKTSKFKLVNIDLDFCARGVRIVGDHTTGQISNISCHGPDSGQNFEGINVDANHVKLQINNVHIYNYNSNRIRVEKHNNFVMVSNVWIDSWSQNAEGNGFPAIEAVEEDSTIMINAGRLFQNGGNNAPNTGGLGTIHIAQYE
jgi:hypothetical protein